MAGTDVANKANGTENSQEMWKKNHWEIIGGLLRLGPPLGSKTQNRVYHVRSDRNSQQSKHNCNSARNVKEEAFNVEFCRRGPPIAIRGQPHPYARY